MGDIARHRNIFFNIRDAIPPSLLDKASISRTELTYLEFGNFMTDVSQFRDPVWYILAKRTVWQEKVLEGASTGSIIARSLAAALAGAGAIGARKFDNSVLSTGSAIAAAAGAVGALALSPDNLADLLGLDDWIDKLFGVPFIAPSGQRRTDDEYGYVGQFFREFIEGVTQMLFSSGAPDRVTGIWNTIEPLSETRVAELYKLAFTQYFPHEHTDQPPYTWDASRRENVKKWYGKSRRQKSLERDVGIMNAVDNAYIPYLADGLSTLAAEWRALRPEDSNERQLMLVRLGKILHGVEDWFFHSNVVELNRVVRHKPQKTVGETDETFVRRFVGDVLKGEKSFLLGDDPRRDPKPTLGERRVEFQRRLYRRLRYPVYDPGAPNASGGTPSKKPSTLRLDFAYPAFPSQQDTAHTLLGALENLESKFHGSGDESKSKVPPGVVCALSKFTQDTPEGRALFRERAKKRGITVPDHITGSADLIQIAATIDREKAELASMDVLREWMPLVMTLIVEDERDRLAANVTVDRWPLAPGEKPPVQDDEDAEIDAQLKRHAKALEPVRREGGAMESNYKLGMRLLRDCNMIGSRSRAAFDRAFAIDLVADKISKYASGAGGVLMIFAVKLHRERVETNKAITEFNRAGIIFDDVTDNGANDEIVGSHSLMSKDTVDSSPFFEDAHVMASVASQSVLHIFLQEVSSPATGGVTDWINVLRRLIRYPPATPGWEHVVITKYREKGQIPKFDDIPELVRLSTGAKVPPNAVAHRKAQFRKRGIDALGLEEEYIRLERVVAKYR